MDKPLYALPTSALKGLKPFENWTECLKVLKQLPQSSSEQEHEALLNRICGSPQRHALAFEILWSLHCSKLQPWGWLEKPMLTTLGDGSEEPNLGARTVPSEVASWVFSELREVHTLHDWKKFAASGRHLWVVLAILKCATNKTVMVEALVALAECVEHCQNTVEIGKRKMVGVAAGETRWIAKLIKSQTPLGSELSKTFVEALFAVNATAELSGELRQESNTLQSRLKSTVEALAGESQAKQTTEASIRTLEAELAEARSALATAETELAAERLHSVRQGGFNTVAKQETINQVLATVRQGTLHRLKNIRVFADRDNPNREEIVDLVEEIERHLAKVEEFIAS